MNNKMKTILVILTAITIISWAWAEQGSETEGRYLSDGTWQLRNQNAIYEYPTPENYSGDNGYTWPEEALSIDWEPEVRLSDTAGFNVFYGAILEGPNGYVHVVVSNWDVGWQPYYIRSTDGGTSWEQGRYIRDVDGPAAISFRLFANGDTVTLPAAGSGQFWRHYSSDAGQTWSDRISSFGPGYTCSSDQLGDTIFTAVNLADGRGYVYYSGDYGARWPGGLPYLGMGGEKALAATPQALHVLSEHPGQEIYYSRFAFADWTWADTVMLSANWAENSFNPLIASWADSNLIAMWLDYEYSPYSWTGDLLYRLSTDQGVSWGEIRQATESHLAHDKDLRVRNDTIFLVYNQTVFDWEDATEEVFFRLSPDGGESWEEPVRLTNDWRISWYPKVAVWEDRIHISFCDARDDLQYGTYKRPYYIRGHIRGPDAVHENQSPMPSGISLSAYPNPFNESTTITIISEEGGDLALSIYDIQGREISKFNIMGNGGGDAKISWDATDASSEKVNSGLYFARARTPQMSKTIKLLLLR